MVRWVVEVFLVGDPLGVTAAYRQRIEHADRLLAILDLVAIQDLHVGIAADPIPRKRERLAFCRNLILDLRESQAGIRARGSRESKILEIRPGALDAVLR